MNKKLQVFVSSTYTDLIEERQAAVQAILDAGHIPAGMELFKAGKSQMKTIRKWIDDSDVYMLILGGRYGSIEEESGLSYTELEYKYALSRNMPVFAIVLNDSFLFTKAASKGKDVIFEKDNCDKYESFKTNVKSNIVKFVKNTDQIFSVIISQLNDILKDDEYNLTGWVKNISNNHLYSLKTNQEQNFDKIIIDAKRVTIIGKTMANIYNLYQNELEESIKTGCEYKILAFDYNENARYILYSEHSYSNHMATNKNFELLQQKYSNFQYKLTTKWPSFGITSIEYEQEKNNFIQILLYTETMKGSQRPMFKINYNNEWYNKFMQEIDKLWLNN